jgi:predicted GNAT family N-acyltransferase
MTLHLVLGDWETCKRDAQDIRYQVFVVEPKVPVELEWDEMDAVCLHAVGYDESGKAVATGRLLPDGHIGRMAVRKEARGGGMGGKILAALMAEAQKRGDRAVMLNAQTQAEPFYQRFGFSREGEEFMEAGIPHIAMRKEF